MPYNLFTLKYSNLGDKKNIPVINFTGLGFTIEQTYLKTSQVKGGEIDIYFTLYGE